jgi:hypothetical protein
VRGSFQTRSEIICASNRLLPAVTAGRTGFQCKPSVGRDAVVDIVMTNKWWRCSRMRLWTLSTACPACCVCCRAFRFWSLSQFPIASCLTRDIAAR